MMSLLVRKIDKGKWLQTDIGGGEDVSADAVTNCLRTKGNALSVWSVATEAQIDEAVLAIVTGHQHLETIDIVSLSREHLAANGIDCEQTQGLTPIQGLQGMHYDLIHLSYQRLGIIAYHIVERFAEEKVIRYTKGRLRSLLNGALAIGRLRREDLSESVRKQL